MRLLVVVSIVAICGCAQQAKQPPLVVDNDSATKQTTRCMVTRAPVDDNQYESKCIESAYRTNSNENWLAWFVRENFIDEAFRKAFDNLFGVDD
ncbi:hypothetical protein QWI17_15435 [Gilvimarinus sp. SDUM040013]|uniref:Lipoprotein n=1 Tax=Gilvimarinus gilvus TaxID=3058038 RepID=A0ABU4S2J0_9GAMM|nr:hypothetical protein [Gilvimarinus sp. SDUM040013]MDO3387234.1 hypothetical protein [Gilvimarinus sp. SDUM040013]MDX6851399.1 hypothetical protein [Gilvimarinus sp. SDUM040013]